MSYVTCQHCNGLHKRNEVCPNKPVSNIKQTTNANKFRNTYKWKKKADSIKRRDNYLCQCCIRHLHNTMKQYNYDDLSVHHIYKVIERDDLKLDDDNLITLCRYHHECAERGIIPVNVLLEIVKEQNNK